MKYIFFLHTKMIHWLESNFEQQQALAAGAGKAEDDSHIALCSRGSLRNGLSNCTQAMSAVVMREIQSFKRPSKSKIALSKKVPKCCASHTFPSV